MYIAAIAATSQSQTVVSKLKKEKVKTGLTTQYEHWSRDHQKGAGRF